MSNLILFFYLSLASARPALLPAVLPLPLPLCLPPLYLSLCHLPHGFHFFYVLVFASSSSSSFSVSALFFTCLCLRLDSVPLRETLVSGISHTLAASFLCSAIMIWLKMGIFVPANVDSQLKSMACTIGAFPVAAKD